MRWVAAITTLILLCIAASGLTIAAPATPPGSIDAEVESTLGAAAHLPAPIPTSAHSVGLHGG